MFDIELMKFNPTAPPFLVMLITSILAFFLSSIIAVTYEFTTKSIYKKAHFLQALTLVGIVAASVLQAIGESVAIGLGILGALSIIRFRSELNDPRNITFMFASLGVGIATGVMAYGIALTGTLVFCLGAILLKFSPLGDANELIGTLKIQIAKDLNLQKEIEGYLRLLCRDFQMNRHRLFIPPKAASTEIDQEQKTEKVQELVYLISLKDDIHLSHFEDELSKIKGIENLQLDFQQQISKL